jgi:hypothetical protein
LATVTDKRKKAVLEEAKTLADKIIHLDKIEDFPLGNLGGIIGKAMLRDRGWYGATIVDGRVETKTLFILKSIA